MSPTYDMLCTPCDTVVEKRCLISEREAQTCEICESPLEPQFSLNTNVFIPARFGYSFSDLFGTTSEKDWLKENPDAERVNLSTFRSKKEKDASERAKLYKEAEDIENTLKARGVFKDYTTEAGATEADV